MNNTEPFLMPEVSLDQEGIESHLAAHCLRHVTWMTEMHTQLITQHGMMHAFGLQGTPQHDRTVEQIRKLEAWLSRGFQSLWN